MQSYLDDRLSVCDKINMMTSTTSTSLESRISALEIIIGTINVSQNESSDDKIGDKQDSSTIIYDDDLDGLGAIFREKETPMSEDNFTPLDPGQWAYDSGHVIEQGAVILGGVEQGKRLRKHRNSSLTDSMT